MSQVSSRLQIDGPMVYATIDIKAEEAREWIMRRLLNNTHNGSDQTLSTGTGLM
jgi:hypothetical protein